MFPHLSAQYSTFYGGQLSSLGVATFVDLAVGSITNNFHQVKDTGRILEK